MLKLEIFEALSPETKDTTYDARQAEKLREAAFEHGYAAGWQDALQHMRGEDDLRRIAAEDALQTISFSYQEAYDVLLLEFTNLAEEMLRQVLPGLTSAAFDDFVRTELRALADRGVKSPIVLKCAPGACNQISKIAELLSGLNITIQAEPSYTHAQVSIGLGTHERCVDFDAFTLAIKEIFEQATTRSAATGGKHA
ncbi:MAG: hypothetical protein ACXIU7_05375 [Roseinatronobacter sp.]